MSSSIGLPRLIVVKSTSYSGGKGNAYYKDDGSVYVGEESVLSTLVKIEVEEAEKMPNYYNLRFCYSNKYWQRKANDRVIVAVSNMPDEDITKPSCTLFEPKVDENNGLYLTHVQSGGRVMIDESTMAVYVGAPSYSPTAGYLNYINWDTLVQLPQNVAFKGFNDSWLGGIWSLGVPYLQFSVDDPTTPITTYKIDQVPDGHIRILSNYFNKYLRRSDTEDWIVGESSDTSFNDKNTLFMPYKYGDDSARTSSIALRNAGNNKFCICLDAHDKTRCLNAGAPNTSNASKIVVQELVSKRTIYNVRYRFDDARTYKVTPFVAGTTSAVNYSDTEAAISVEVGYVETRSSSFTRGFSVNAGVKAVFEAGIPVLFDYKFEVSAGLEGDFQWNTTTTTEKSAHATGTVQVPPRTRAVVNFMGTTATYDVPFSYTQDDTSSTNGKILTYNLTDGMYKGVNGYNFYFEIAETHPL